MYVYLHDSTLFKRKIRLALMLFKAELAIALQISNSFEYHVRSIHIFGIRDGI